MGNFIDRNQDVTYQIPITVPNCENLPTELLEQIFWQLSSLKDIQNCFFVCSKWRKIIEKLYGDKGNYNNITTNYNSNTNVKIFFRKIVSCIRTMAL